jgi:hypothetical protein
MKKLIIFAAVDFMGDTEVEYQEIEERMRELFPDHAISYRHDEESELMPQNLEDEDTIYNVYVFDWGGLLPGANDLTQSIYHSLLANIMKYPQRLFIMWSAFTESYYKDACTREFPQFIAPNVIFRQDKRIEERCRLFWFGD